MEGLDSFLFAVAFSFIVFNIASFLIISLRMERFSHPDETPIAGCISVIERVYMYK